jgi:hypothetical protein
MTRKETIAAAIANARGARNGVPPISNILEMLECVKPNLLAEVLDDAAAVEKALDEFDGAARVASPDPELYAWVGADELGSGGVGIKQAAVPAGYVPLACIASDVHKIRHELVINSLQAQVNVYKKQIRLVRYVPVGTIVTLDPHPRRAAGSSSS